MKEAVQKESYEACNLFTQKKSKHLCDLMGI